MTKTEVHPSQSSIVDFISKCWVTINQRQYAPYILGLMFIIDVLLSIVILLKIKYTEIDWVAYMQEVSGFLGGELDYSNLRGDTGPLVYPAAFVYIYSGLYYLTDHGTNIFRAQVIFTGIYLLSTLCIMFILYKTEVVPPCLICLVSLSKRLHSIYILRCFNDCVAMLLLYIAIIFFIYNYWKLGSVIFSLSVGVKMNILLFAPGLFVLYIYRFNRNMLMVSYHILLCAAVQLLIGLPFLVTYPIQYLKGSFDLGRVFIFKWTVNWKFLPEDLFVDKTFAKYLLMCHLLLLLIAFWRLELASGLFGMLPVLRQGSGKQTQKQQKSDNHSDNSNGITPCGDAASSHPLSLASNSIYDHVDPTNHPEEVNLTPFFIVSRLFISNFIGILLARSLHYQFYSWYCQHLPLLLLFTRLPTVTIPVVYGVIEYVWNVYPSTPSSSLIWQLVHWLVFVGIIANAHQSTMVYDSRRRYLTYNHVKPVE